MGPLFEFFMAAEELDKNDFEATFGVIGKDLPSLPEWTGTFGDIGENVNDAERAGNLFGNIVENEIEKNISQLRILI